MRSSISLAIIILSVVLVADLSAAIPKPRAGNRYGDGRTVATSGTTKHVEGREYTSADGTKHRRVLIYTKDGSSFRGYSKLGREKGDAKVRHYFNK